MRLIPLRGLLAFASVALLGAFLVAAAPLSTTGSAAVASACSECRDCGTCTAGMWGGNSCDFEGGAECPCQETGGNCNPTMSLNLDAPDKRTIETGFGPVVVARLDKDVFGTWACEDGELTVAFEEAADGRYVEVTGEAFDRYQAELPLEVYLRERVRPVVLGSPAK